MHLTYEKTYKHYNYVYNSIYGLFGSFIDENNLNNSISEKNETNKNITINDDCIICSGNIIDVILCCNHAYCFDCFIKLFIDKKECAICKSEMNINNIVIKKKEKSFIDFIYSLNSESN